MTDTDTKFEVRDASPEVHTDPAGASEAGTDLQALSAAATAGPWVASNEHSGYYWRIETDAVGYPNDGWVIASEMLGPDAQGNAAYIVALVNAHREGRLVERGKPVVTDAMVERAAEAWLDALEPLLKADERFAARADEISWRQARSANPNQWDLLFQYLCAAIRAALEDRLLPAPDMPMPTEGEGQ